MNNDNSMNLIELKASWGLGCVFFLRMLGIFMVLPILTTYGITLKHANNFLIGIAIGIYGLMQAIFQIPYGLLSDKIGRKPLIIFGLILFIIGSIIAATSISIWGIIIGRALQGSGTIAAPIMALLSDLTREQHRTKAMAFIGINFGVSFAIAIIIGPIVTNLLGINGLFGLMAVLAFLCILIILFIVPSAKNYILNRELGVVKSKIIKIFLNKKLIKINLGILILHTLLMFTFITLPIQFKNINFPINQHWKIYFSTMLISFLLVIPFILYAEIKRRMKLVIIICIFTIILSELILFKNNNYYWLIVIGIQLFFFSFNLLEAILPSLISKESPIGHKGTAMGIYSTSQFIGVAIGGSFGGWFIENFFYKNIFLISTILSIIWFLISLSIKEPLYLSSLRIVIKDKKLLLNNKFLLDKLKSTPGIHNILFVPEEKSLYVKVDNKIINRSKIELLIKNN